MDGLHARLACYVSALQFGECRAQLRRELAYALRSPRGVFFERVLHGTFQCFGNLDGALAQRHGRGVEVHVHYRGD